MKIGQEGNPDKHAYIHTYIHTYMKILDVIPHTHSLHMAGCGYFEKKQVVATFHCE
jgi:hypothetical protein